MNINEKISVLMELKPYLEKYRDKIIVIKFGGNAMINEEIKNSVLEDAVLLQAFGMKPVISHGGGPAINNLLEKLNIKSEFVNGLRVTSKDVIDVVEMALLGKVNGELVRKVTTNGGAAVGLSGVSAGIYFCEKRKSDVDYGYVGEVLSVNPEPIKALLEAGYIPVVAPLGADKEGNCYNINGDTAAGELASALDAEKLFILTDIEGLCNSIELRDVISYLNISDVPKLKEKGVIAGGMIPKVDSCVRAIENGVNSVHIIDGRQAHSILFEALTKEDYGTVIGTEKASVGIK